MVRKPRKRAEAGSEKGPALRLEWRSPAELAENPRNWRKHPESQEAALAGVLSEVGWAGACLFNERTGRLIDGHLRRKVAQLAGAEKIPVLVGAWSEADEAKILASLDPIAGLAEADPVKLDALLRDVTTGCAELQQMLDDLWQEAQDQAIADAEPGEEDTPPELEEAVVTRPGDLWTLGDHRMLCGDCRDPAAWERLVGGEQVNAIVSDPPYGMDWNTDSTRFSGGNQPNNRRRGQGRNWGAIKGDAEPFDPSPWLDFPKVILWGSNHFCQKLPTGTTLIWIKRSDDLFGTFLSDAELAWMKGGHGVYCFRKQFPPPSRMAENQGECAHPTQKPISLIVWCIERCGDVQNIADPYAGSGTTLMACEHLGRRCFGCEIEPAYVDVCLRRYISKHDGDAVRHDGKKWSKLSSVTGTRKDA